MRRAIVRLLLRKADPAELRDIAMHVVVMRRTALEAAHMHFHGVPAFVAALHRDIYVRHAVLLAKHLGLIRVPDGGALVMHLFIIPRVDDVVARIIERESPCPGLHDHAAQGIEEAEAHANGETP